ncbi:OmpA family protein [Flavobacterium sp. ASW18X]|uniref:OmpA family protein n=1 Tax=Flavobacterium sp. ASW18X TaxID=2572595 RepID=UPI0010ADE85E|nr:OmpA family protein [Flavobacterium sp. ASW18X]TKD55485.1 OmpA family protein [Flavobacterium sp. ASW18X]
MIKQLTIAIIGLCFVSLSAQKKVDKAKNYDHYGYMVDTSPYKKLLDNGMPPLEIYKTLGNANYLKGKYDVASYWYAKLMERTAEKDYDPNYLFRLSLCLKSIGEYEASDRWMEKFVLLNPSDLRAKQFAANRDYLKKINQASVGTELINLKNINTSETDFAPAILNQQLVYATAKTKDTDEKLKRPYLNLYSAELTEGIPAESPKQFSTSVNTEANESSIVFSKDGKTMYFTRNNMKKGKFVRDKNGISRLKIYRSHFKNGQWSPAEDLSFNSDLYSTAHPALDTTGTTLYFSSDMPGTHGASDIFKVEIRKDGSFGTPVNLGPEINTEAKENFPFVATNGKLHFASDGHPGLGGMDIFKFDEELQKVINLGAPINSQADDFSYVTNPDATFAYLASNRTGGAGQDDIYVVKLADANCEKTITGWVKEESAESTVADASILFIGDGGQELLTVNTAADGSFTATLPCQEEITIIAGKDGYRQGTFEIRNFKNDEAHEPITITIGNDGATGTDLVKLLQLDPIYFDLNSSYLRYDAYANLDKVVTYLKAHPEVNLEIGSHTDSREEDAYNLWLSNRRAKRTQDYIISKGISTARLSAKGYGETRLVNSCSNNIECTENEHQKNRRSEFIIKK